MYLNVKPTFNSLCFYSRRKLLFVVSLLFVMSLGSLGFLSAFNGGVCSFAYGASSVLVSTEVELVNAINNASGPLTITLDNDIVITNSSLIIPPNKDITLTSNRADGFYKLIGTISIHNGGTLRLAGVIVTHVNDAWGCGVIVYLGGQLFMSDGEIIGNYAMLGGGGGVSVYGSFTLTGGKISNNTAHYGGGGVSVKYGGSFTMTGGIIANNKAMYTNAHGTNVYGSGGGIDVYEGSFSMSGGNILGNTAQYGGGVYVASEGSFSMSGGNISDNAVLADSNNYSGFGGGVFLYSSTFINKTGGNISNNTGGDMYTYNDKPQNNSNLSTDNTRLTSNDPNNEPLDNNKNSFSLNNAIITCISILAITMGTIMSIRTFKKSRTNLLT
jgi:hypothetical protein